MSKILYVISKHDFDPGVSVKLKTICERLSPDNITPTPPYINLKDPKIGIAVMNPTDSLEINGSSVLMGKAIDAEGVWSRVGTGFPDGSFALFRSQNDKVEIISDYTGSRTIWYYFDAERLICSTSQRAIVMYLESFEFNEKVIPWVLSTGSLGPVCSWDKRIHRLELNSSLSLDRLTWEFTPKKIPIAFKINRSPKISHEKALRDALDDTFRQLNLDFSKWVLPLSGGYDSRAILSLLKKNSKHEGLRTLSWGLKSSIYEKDNDAYVAKKIAAYQNVPHKYYHTDLVEEDLTAIIDRFLYLGEGRIDHFRGYLDGFKLFKSLFEDGIQGILRGDECFESTSEPSEFMTRLMTGYLFCSDLTNLNDYESYGLAHQELPDYLKQREDENLAEWGHRLYLEFRLPVINAALNDLKVSYVEIINPLLSRRIIDTVCESPLSDRKNKKLIIKIINSISPPIEIAKKDAIASTSYILKDKTFLTILQQKLGGSTATAIFPVKFLSMVQKGVEQLISSPPQASESKGIKTLFKRFSPAFIKTLYRDKVMPKKLPSSTLGFRTFIITRMNEILEEDGLLMKGKKQS